MLQARSSDLLTSPIAVFRFHRRNFEGHLKQLQGKQPTVAEQYDDVYSKGELERPYG